MVIMFQLEKILLIVINEQRYHHLLFGLRLKSKTIKLQIILSVFKRLHETNNY